MNSILCDSMGKCPARCRCSFKATPASGWTFAHTIAQDRVHELNSGYSLNRFNTGHLIDEKGLGTKTWIS